MGTTAAHFESEPCSRCGGSGQHSFNGSHSICYKCGGAKLTLTKAGIAARGAWLAANIDEIPVADLRVGDTIRTSTATLSELIAGSGGRDILAKVTAIEVGDFGRSKTGDADWITFTHSVQINKDASRRTYTADQMVKRWILRLALPPEMEPGTPRRAEMKAYAASAKVAA